jgi:hypothetical protein
MAVSEPECPLSVTMLAEDWPEWNKASSLDEMKGEVPQRVRRLMRRFIFVAIQ